MLKVPQFPTAHSEFDFWQRRDDDQFGMRRWLLLLGAFLMWTFGVMDWIVAGESFSTLFAVRTAAAIGMLTCTYLFCLAKTRQARERFILVFGCTAIVGEILLCAAAPPESLNYYLFGLTVVLSFGAVLIAPTAKTTSRLFTVLVVSYAVMVPFLEIEMVSLIITTIFVLLIAAAATIGSFERERLERLRGISEAELAVSNAELVESRKEAVRARDKEIEANQAKNRFIAGVSHELRTPLNSIIGFSDAMRSELFGAIQPSRYGEYIDFIYSSGQILQANISDLMDMARIDSGKLGWVDADFCLSKIVNQAMATCRASADEAGVALTLEVGCPNVMIHADAARITQAILNLTTNAIKFTAPGGQVTVATNLRHDGSVSVAVADTGRGMSAEDLASVREPFTQMHEDSAGGSKGGLGLGLAIVSGILDQIDGQLEIDSEIDVGTCASLIVPAYRVVAEQKQAA